MSIRSRTTMVVSAIITLMMPSIPLLSNENDTSVEAAICSTADAAGYSWIDSRSPDPKITYEWIDCTKGTSIKSQFGYRNTPYDVYCYRGTPAISLPFFFPFYGNVFDKIWIWPSGIMAFQNTTYGHAYYPVHGFPWKDDDRYAPALAIAPYFRYNGGVQISGADSNVYTISGTNDTGVKYWACEWHNVIGYDFVYNYGFGKNVITNGDNNITFQAVLHEDGIIRFNYKDVKIGECSGITNGVGIFSVNCTPYSEGGYALVGIQNKARDIGLTYFYNSSGSVKDGGSVVIMNYATDISDVHVSKGFGPDDKIHPAMNGYGVNTAIDATLYSKKGIAYLTTYDITVGAEEKIVLRYDFTKGAFLKLNDSMRLIVLDEKKSHIEMDPVHPLYKMKVHMEFDFNLWWENYDPVDLYFDLKGNGVASSKYKLEGALKVESRITLVGVMTVEDSRGITISSGGWVAGDEVLRFSGVHREYYGLGPDLVPPDFIKAGVIDQAGVKYFGTVPELDLNVMVDAVFPQMSFKLIMDNVTAMHDLTPLEMKAEFTVRIDSDLPGIPGDLKIFADQLTDNAQDYDNDPEVYLTWTDAVDASSGVAYYHISVNKDLRQASEKDVFTVPNGTNAWVLKNLPKGINKIYMWSEDSVGNEGGDVFTIVKVDINDPVTFNNFFPKTGSWITNRTSSCSIRINDTITGVDPRTIEYEFTTKGEADLTGSWQSIQESFDPDNSLYIVVTEWFQNGKLNYMRFRAKDVAGNGFFVSGNYNVWVDAEGPSFSLKSPLEGEYCVDPIQQVRIDIKDLDSGIDLSSIEYRVSTQGKTSFGPWMPYKNTTGGPSQVTIQLREEFERGDRNYIQVRARDIARNQRTSEFFNLKICSFPIVIISSPSPEETYYEGEIIIFDATGSYDPDGRNQVRITWYRNSDDGFVTFLDGGYGSFDDFMAGAYRITVEVKSGDLVSTESFTLRIYPRLRTPPPWDKVDTDGDGMPDWWEIEMGGDYQYLDPDDDPDNDGFTNIQEYENGTRPLDPRSHPPIPPGEEPSSAKTPPLWVGIGAAGMIMIAYAISIGAIVYFGTRKKKTVRKARKIKRS